MNKLFTVIVLVYNNSEYLEECLRSIIDQDYSQIEIIVADDKSKHFNKDAIEHFIQSNPKNNIVSYKVYQNSQNFGTVKSANNALSCANGFYIKLLAADDALHNSKTLSYAYEYLNKSSDGIIIGDVIKCNSLLQPISMYRNSLKTKINRLSSHDVFCRLCVSNGIVAGSVFFDKRFFSTYGTFDETYRLLEDWPTWLKVTKRGCRISYYKFYTILYRSDIGVGTSGNSIYMNDRRLVFDRIIRPAKKDLGAYWYAVSFLSNHINNASFIRKVYGLVFRKKRISKASK